MVVVIAKNLEHPTERPHFLYRSVETNHLSLVDLGNTDVLQHLS